MMTVVSLSSILLSSGQSIDDAFFFFSRRAFSSHSSPSTALCPNGSTRGRPTDPSQPYVLFYCPLLPIGMLPAYPVQNLASPSNIARSPSSLHPKHPSISSQVTFTPPPPPRLYCPRSLQLGPADLIDRHVPQNVSSLRLRRRQRLPQKLAFAWLTSP